MKIEQMRYLIDLAKTGSFTKTAQNFFITQSTLSYSIQQMEKDVGRRLFERTAWHGVTLTSFGEVFLEFCINTVTAYDTLVYCNDENTFIDLPAEIRIASCSSLTSILIEKLRDYMDVSYPEVTLTVTNVNYESIFDAVLNDYDLGLISVRKDLLEQKNTFYGYEVIQNILLEDYYVCVCHKNFYQEVCTAIQNNKNAILENLSSLVFSRDDYFRNPMLIDALKVLMREGGTYLVIPKYVHQSLFDTGEYPIISLEEGKLFCHALLRNRKARHPIYKVIESQISEITKQLKQQYIVSEH